MWLSKSDVRTLPVRWVVFFWFLPLRIVRGSQGSAVSEQCILRGS